MFKPGTIHEDFLVDHNIRMRGNHLSVTSKYNEDTNLFNCIKNFIYMCVRPVISCTLYRGFGCMSCFCGFLNFSFI